MNENIEIGLEILGARIEDNITQRKLASLIGTQQPSIARVERGAVSPTIAFLSKIAKAMNRKWIFALVKDDERFNNKGTITFFKEL